MNTHTSSTPSPTVEQRREAVRRVLDGHDVVLAALERATARLDDEIRAARADALSAPLA